MIEKSPAWLASASPSQSLLFSPDGQFLAGYAGDGRIQVWHLERGQAILPESSPGWTWDFSPDSRQVAIGRPDGSIDLYDLFTGKETRRLRGASALGQSHSIPAAGVWRFATSQRLPPCRSGTWLPGPFSPSGISQRRTFWPSPGIPTASASPWASASPTIVPRFGMWRPDAGSRPWKATGRT